MKRAKQDLHNHFLSIIIPTYKAEEYIEKDLVRVRNVLEQIRYPYEIICVIDGKTDKSYENAKKTAKKYSKNIRVVGYKNNLGKGHAVRFGMAKAKGDIVAFIDAGMEIDPNSLSMLLEHFEWYDADIVIGSKRHQASKVTYPWQRKILSFGYQMLVGILFGLKVKDTQVGMKFFKREVLEKTLPRLLVKAFAFDIEMLSVANYLGFKRIYEAPVELKMKFGGASTLASKGFIKITGSMLWDTMAVFYRLRILHYYDDKNRKNWTTSKYLAFNNNKK
jgi:glycosyltransferase involved in cell wall biosynthesis